VGTYSAGTWVDLALVAGWWVATIAICWFAAVPWIFANFLVLGVPLAYLLLRSRDLRRRLRAGFIVKYVLFVVVFFDYLAVRYGGWGGPSSLPTLPGGVNVEQITWTALIIPLAIALNEACFPAVPSAPQRRYPRTILAMMFCSGFVIALAPPLHGLFEGHVYLKIGLSLYPIVFALAILVNPAVWRALVVALVVFGAFNLAFELLALHLEYWSFDGSYVGFVDVAGYRFPVEELVFLVLLCAPAVIATYSLYKNWKGIDVAR
jgi:hypothetical protein